MDATQRKTLANGLDRYFSTFDSTRSLVSELINSAQHAMEVLILLCARLDSLASETIRETASSRQAFTHFVTTYAGHRRLLESVSVGDLYHELGYHRWLLDGTIPKAGRLYRFSRIDDPALLLLERAGLPLTFEDSDRLLGTLITILQREFHVKPGQPRSKVQLATAKTVKATIAKAAEQTRLKSIARNLPEALSPLLERKKVSSILYDKFRCEAIHEGRVLINERRFFKETGPYWERWQSEYYGPFELIEFPARFLLECLESSIGNYRTHLMAKGQVPPGIHFHMFDDVFEHLELLDPELLEEGGAVRLKIDGR